MKRKEENNPDLENMSFSSDQPEHESLPDANIELTDRVAKLEAELTETNDKYLRLYSEFENFKKRVSKERVDLVKMAGSDIFSAFLPIIDDFERAMKSSEETNDTKAIKEGVRLIYTKLKSMVESRGLKEMNSLNKPFDADLHDAIANIPAESEDQKGMVVEEIEKGYYLNDRVIRHAKVVVAN